jgi:hypothetical protein
VAGTHVLTPGLKVKPFVEVAAAAPKAIPAAASGSLPASVTSN